MPKVLYITSSSYSGSTLLSFLLNTHPAIFTVGEMKGWNYGQNETFMCSCGEILNSCPLFRKVQEAFFVNGLPFDFRNFGTNYRLSSNDQLNRLLSGSIPGATFSSSLEKIREKLLNWLPVLSRPLAQIDRANLVFMNTALLHSRAKVFVDACKDPHRLRQLRRISDLKLQILYLVRDFRGVALSNRKNKGWEIAFSTKLWIHQQRECLRVVREFPSVLQIYYEEICKEPNRSLGIIHRFIGLPTHSFDGDFRAVEHHILGNTMRLNNIRKIINTEKWKEEFTDHEITTINQIAESFAKKNSNHPVSKIIDYYLEN